MPHVQRFDHVGITVADLDTVTEFFVALGLEVEGRTFVEGEFVDTVTGIPDSRTEIAMLRPPDGGTRLELSSFVRPDHAPGSPAAMANELGLRNVAFEVADLHAAVDELAAEGTGSSAVSVSTRTAGGWPMCGGRRGSSSPWPSASADALPSHRHRVPPPLRPAPAVYRRQAWRPADEEGPGPVDAFRDVPGAARALCETREDADTLG